MTTEKKKTEKKTKESKKETSRQKEAIAKFREKLEKKAKKSKAAKFWITSLGSSGAICLTIFDGLAIGLRIPYHRLGAER